MDRRLALLEMLSDKYPGDKKTHGYLPFYAKYLPVNILSFLEIGVDKGYSARMFDEFYGREAEIHLVDLFAEYGHMMPRRCRELGFVPFVGDQSDTAFLQRLPISYDVIVEDGSHLSHHQIITFKELFWGKLKQGGVYFMEDLHCGLDKFYWGGLVVSEKNTALEMFKNFIKNGQIENPYFTPQDGRVFESLIDTVELCAGDKMAIIKRK